MLKNVTLLNKAVSNSNEPLSFFREGADGGRIYSLKESKEVIKVDSITLDNLLDQLVHVDFLKMDIEGSESDVIVSSENLGNVQQLFIEYHSFKDAEQTLGAMLEKLKESGFRYYIHTQFCSPKPLIVEELQLGMDLQLNIFAKRK